MTTIDWTKTVETCEDPPRPVRVLITDNDVPGYPVVAMVGRQPTMFTKNGTEFLDEAAGITLRNVAPPKPEPVLREAWVVWDSDGAVLVCSTETSARVHGGVYARAAVMSDGSPVPGEAPNISAISVLRMEKQGLEEKRDHWKAKAEALQAEVDRMRPMVEVLTSGRYCEAIRELQEATLEYEESQS